ncbi:MAG: hypothetical protein AAF242_16670, partial [Bacteroidota bacterium]
MDAEFIEHIEDHLTGNISREDLERRAKEHGVSNLDQEIEWYQDSITAIQAAGLRNQLQDVLPKPQKREAKIRRMGPRRWIMTIAASLLVLVVAYFGFFNNGGNDLYAQFEYVDPGLPVVMSQSDDYLFNDAMSYFGEGNYKVAEEKLQQIQNSGVSSDTLTYFLG